MKIICGTRMEYIRYVVGGKSGYLVVSVLIAAFGLLVSCTSDDEVVNIPIQQPQVDERVPRCVVMNFEGGLIPYDAVTRTTTEEWVDGAKVYLQFSAEANGVATYNATAAQWTVEYYGDLVIGTETKCEAYYFENAGDASPFHVALTEHSAIYVDKEAVYMFNDTTLTVAANLMPMVGRIRLKGDIAESYRFSGVKFYNSYNILKNSFTSDEKYYISSTGDDGYSPYYYVFFSSEGNRELCFDDMASGFSFVKTFGENVLAAGRSGYLNIPSKNKQTGWTILTKDIAVADTTFRMIRVLYANDNAVRHFYIGETEVTQKLWEIVMGSGNNPSTFKGADMPVNNISWNECNTFLSKLNELTGLPFRFPSKKEWEYAAKGGCASQGYVYSGSDNVDDVAWYNGNSDNTIHSVKSKQSNEIGIYDMSGNVAEIIGTYYGYNYYRNYFYYRAMGGCFDESATIGYKEYQVGDLYHSSSITWDFCTSKIGLRIAID